MYLKLKPEIRLPNIFSFILTLITHCHSYCRIEMYFDISYANSSHFLSYLLSRSYLLVLTVLLTLCTFICIHKPFDSSKISSGYIWQRLSDCRGNLDLKNNAEQKQFGQSLLAHSYFREKGISISQLNMMLTRYGLLIPPHQDIFSISHLPSDFVL